MKTPQRLGNWFQRYQQLKDWTNNKKQKKLSALFGCKNSICEFRLILVDHITYGNFDGFWKYIAQEHLRTPNFESQFLSFVLFEKKISEGNNFAQEFPI